MADTHAMLEVMNVTFTVPVAQVRKPRRIRRPDSLAAVPVTIRAGFVVLSALRRIPGHRPLRMRVGQGADVRNHVLYCGVVGERRGKRHHLLSVRILIARAAYSELEILQLPRQIPARLTRELR